MAVFPNPKRPDVKTDVGEGSHGKDQLPYLQRFLGSLPPPSGRCRASLGVREGSTRASPCPSSGDVEPSALPSKSLSPGTDGCVREEAEVPPSLLLWLLRTGRPPPEAPGRPGPSGPSSFLQAGLLPSLNRSDFLTEGPSLQRAKTLLFIPKQTESIPTPLHPSFLRGLPT